MIELQMNDEEKAKLRDSKEKEELVENLKNVDIN